MSNIENRKQAREERRQTGYCEIRDFADANKLEVRFLTPYQIRVGDMIDLYPTSRKYCVLRTCLWGHYRKIEELLTFFNQ